MSECTRLCAGRKRLAVVGKACSKTVLDQCHAPILHRTVCRGRFPLYTDSNMVASTKVLSLLLSPDLYRQAWRLDERFHTFATAGKSSRGAPFDLK